MTQYPLKGVAGVDEVGRGPLAGAVVAAAVILKPDHAIGGLKDSKALTVKKREQLDLDIREHAVAFCIARAEVEEIDEVNILQASFLAMQRAVAGLNVAPEFVIVDGNRTPGFGCPSDSLIKGDTKHEAIKAASIIAKVARDKEMIEFHQQYPEFGFDRHKGYPTAAHLAVLQRLGPTPIHRMSFAPCRAAKKKTKRR